MNPIISLPIDTLCPSGGLNSYGTPRTLRPPGEAATLNITATAVDVGCSKKYGCGKKHTRNYFADNPAIISAFDEGRAQRIRIRQAADSIESETAAPEPVVEAISIEHIPEEAAPETRSVRTRKTQERVAAELHMEEMSRKMLEIIGEKAFSYEALTKASPILKKDKAKISAAEKATLWKNIYGVADVAFCPICRTHRIFPENYHAGHIFPECRGGETKESNLIPICSGCNMRMGDMHLYYFAWAKYDRVLFC